MLFYCEKHITNGYTVFDVENLKDLEYLFHDLDLNWNYSDERSLIIVKGIKTIPHGGPLEGKWYYLPLSFWENFQFELKKFSFENNQTSSLIFRLEATLKHDVYFLNFNSNKVFFNPSSRDIQKNITRSPTWKSLRSSTIPKIQKCNNLELKVFNVEFGNWNEITDKLSNFRLIYDIGADLEFDGADIIRLVQRAKLDSGSYHVVLSHWDLDHYHALLGMFDSEIKNICTFTAPSNTPNTCTFKRAWNLLNKNGVKPWLIPPSIKKPNGGNRVQLRWILNLGFIDLYRSTDGARKNQSGIVLLIRGPKADALLPGDHHYSQLYKDIIQPRHLVNFEIIVPHHCGNAGVFDKSAWGTLSIRGATISTLKNRYKNVPISSIHNFFSKQSLNFFCTDCTTSDITRLI